MVEISFVESGGFVPPVPRRSRRLDGTWPVVGWLGVNPHFSHEPVMAAEVLEVFADLEVGVFVDATLGGGGHAAAILAAHPDLTLVGFDRDPVAIAAATDRLAAVSDRVHIVHARFDAMAVELERLNVPHIGGVLFDLGVSSPQLDQAERGFSFRRDGPLDMRMDQSSGPDAASLVNEASEQELSDILYRHGDERHARRVARAIVAARPVLSTTALATIVAEAMPAASRRSPGHPARRTFQALRIAVNAELDVLAPALQQAIDRMGAGARGVVLTYHSGEDRIVKRALRSAAALDRPYRRGLPEPDHAVIKLLHRKGRTASEAELERNPRASSARMRSFERLEVAA